MVKKKWTEAQLIMKLKEIEDNMPDTHWFFLDTDTIYLMKKDKNNNRLVKKELHTNIHLEVIDEKGEVYAWKVEAEAGMY